jgi:hypothetical protein
MAVWILFEKRLPTPCYATEGRTRSGAYLRVLPCVRVVEDSGSSARIAARSLHTRNVSFAAHETSGSGPLYQ